jgi:hypothetical protein
VGIMLGNNPAVLSSAVDEAMMRGLKRSRCKILLPLSAGEHEEVMLPEGQLGFGYDGTSCYMNLEATVPELRTLLKPSDVSADAIDRVNAYLSHGGSGTPLHFDARAVWIVQLVGTKFWMVSKTQAVENPSHNCVAPGRSTWVDYDGTRLTVPTDFVMTVLWPGDWLFVPKAAWHATFSNSGSVSATLAAPPSIT